MSIEFDPIKNQNNQAKHGVGFEEAQTVLLDPLALVGEDFSAAGEHRYITLGISAQGRVLVVVWTPRGNKARLISAWKANATQRQRYEQQ